MDYSKTKINFLGVTVTKVGNKLETDLYYKPNDRHQYLHAQSCHLNVYKRSIAYGQVIRFKIICSIEEKLNNLILLRAHKQVLKSPRRHSTLPSLPKVAFRNPKTIRDKLVRSKLSELIY